MREIWTIFALLGMLSAACGQAVVGEEPNCEVDPCPPAVTKSAYFVLSDGPSSVRREGITHAKFIAGGILTLSATEQLGNGGSLMMSMELQGYQGPGRYRILGAATNGKLQVHTNSSVTGSYTTDVTIAGDTRDAEMGCDIEINAGPAVLAPETVVEATFIAKVRGVNQVSLEWAYATISEGAFTIQVER